MITLKQQVNCQLNIVILKHFANYEMFRKMLFFSSQIYLKKILYITQGFLNYTSASIHKYIILCDRKYPAVQVQISRRGKASLRSVPQVDCVRPHFGPLL